VFLVLLLSEFDELINCTQKQHTCGVVVSQVMIVEQGSIQSYIVIDTIDTYTNLLEIIKHCDNPWKDG